MNWQFHFRNFNQSLTWFGAYHAGCGEAPWHDGRPKCWHNKINYNPTGGDNSVYVPSSFIVDFAQWLNVIIDGLKEVEDICLIVATEGEDPQEWIDAVQDIFGITEDAVKAALQDNNIDLAQLMGMSNAAFQKSAQAVGKTPQQLTDIMNQMGLSGSGFIASDTYKKLIHDDSNINDDYGWTILANGGTGNHIANHAFLNQGHLCYYFNSDDVDGFWNNF